ncbi:MULTISPECIES: hypothetical protein [Desulfofundulus]|nr:hypothetical protein [Thermoanaerobacter sp.]
MLVDCPAATTDVPKVAAAKGYTTAGVTRIGEGEWQVTLEAPRTIGV